MLIYLFAASQRLFDDCFVKFVALRVFFAQQLILKHDLEIL